MIKSISLKITFCILVLSKLCLGQGCNNFVKISAGQYRSRVIKNDGTMLAWGTNYYGELGNGSTTNTLTPVQIGTGDNWKSASDGINNSVGIKADGTLWA